MSSRTLTVISILCIIAIFLSGFNSYLVLSSIRIQQEQLSQLQNAIDEAENLLNQSRFVNLTELRTAISNLEKTVSLLNQTPANVYEAAYKSVVVIRTPIGQGSGFLY
ncbi:MAG: hypothetical protein ACE5NN_07575, partial [Candidatus Bathyarchaeia archaeon]